MNYELLLVPGGRLKRLFTAVSLLILFLVFVGGASAADYYWTGATSNDWNTPANWDDGSGSNPYTVSFPGATDNVFIDTNGGTVTITDPLIVLNQNADALSLTINYATGQLDTSAANNYSLAVAGDIVISSGTLTTNDSAVSVSGSLSNSDIFTAGNSTISVGGSWTNNGTFTANGSAVSLGGTGGAIDGTNGANGANAFNILTITGNAYTSALALDVSSALTISGGSLTQSANALNADSITLNGGDLSVAVSYTVTSDVVVNVAASNLSGAGTGTIGGNLDISDGAVDSTGPIGITGDVLLSGGTLLGTGRTLTVDGDWNQSAGTFTHGGSSVVVLAVGGNGITAIDPFYDLTVNVSATQNSNVTVAGTLTTGTGIYATGTNDLSAGTLLHNTVAGTITGGTGTISVVNGSTIGNANNITKTGGTIEFITAGSEAITGTVALNAGAGTVTISRPVTGTSALTITAGTINIGSSITTNSVVFSGPVILTADSSVTSSTGVITFGSTVNTDGTVRTLGLNAATTLTFSGVVGSVANPGTRPGTLTVDSTTTTQSAAIYLAGDLLNQSGTWSTGTNTLTLTGSLVNGGTLTAGTTTISVGASWTNNGTFTANGSTVSLGGTGGAIDGTNGANGANAFNILTITGNAYTSALALDVSSALTISGGSLTQSANALNADSITLNGGDLSVAVSYTVTSDVVVNVAASNLSGAGTGTIGGNLDISDGAVDSTGPIGITGDVLLSGGTLLGTGRTLTVDGDWNQSAGTFTHGGSSVVVLAVGGNGITAIDPFYDLTVNVSATQNSNVTVAGTLTTGTGIYATGTNDLSVGTLLHNTVAGTITGGTGTISVVNGSTIGNANNITKTGGTIEFITAGSEAITGTVALNAGAGTVTISRPVTGTSALTITAGTINIGSSITTNSVVFSGPVILTADSSVTSSTGVITFGSTVNTDGTVRTLGLNAATTLTFSGVVGSVANPGTRPGTLTVDSTTTTQSAAIYLAGDLLNQSGTWSTGTNTLTLTGSLVNGGTLTAGTTTISVGASWTNNGTFTANGSTVSLGGTGGAIDGTNGANGANAFNILTITGNAYTSALALDVSSALTISGGSLTQSANALNADSITLNGGDLSVAVSYTVTSDVVVNVAASNLSGAGTGTIGGNLDISDGAVDSTGPIGITGDVLLSGGTLLGTGRTLTVDGDWNQSAGTFTHGGSSVVVLAVGGNGITAIDPFYDLTVNVSATQNSNVTVAGTLTTGTGIYATGTNDLSVGTLLHNTVAGTITGGTGTISVVNGSTIGNANNITKTGGTIEFITAGSEAITGTVALNAGAGTVTISRPVTGTSALTITAGTINIGSSITTNSVVFSGPVILTADSSVTSSTGVITFGSTVNTDGTVRTLGLNAATTLTFSGVVGSVANPGTRPGTLTVDSTTTTQSAAIYLAGDLLNQSGTWSTGTNTLTLTGSLVNGGTLTAGTTTISVGASWTNNGTFTANGSTVSLGGTGGAIDGTNGANGANAFNILTITGNAYTSALALDVSSALTISGGSLTQSANALNADSITLNGGDLSVAVSYTVTSDVVVNVAASNLSGAGTGTIGGNLDISDGAVDSTGPIGITGDVLLSGGTLLGTGRTLTVDGDWNQSAGTFTHGGSSVVVLAVGGNGITAIDPFYDLTVNVSATQNSNVTVAGTLTTGTGIYATGTNDLSAGTLLHNTVAGTITGGTGTISVVNGSTIGNANNITKTGGTIEFITAGSEAITGTVALNAGAGTVTISRPVTGTSALTITAGTINIGSSITTNSVVFSGPVILTADSSVTSSTGVITFGSTVNTDGTVRTLGLNAATTLTFSGVVGSVANPGTRPGTLTVDSTTTTQSAEIYLAGDLLNQSGTWSTGTNTLTLTGSLVNGGTLTAGTTTISVGASWTNNGTFTANGSTVSLGGTGGAIDGTNGANGANAFNILTITGNAYTSALALDVSSALTISGGSLTQSANALNADSITLNGGDLSVAVSYTVTSDVVVNVAASNLSGAGTGTIGGNLDISDGAVDSTGPIGITGDVLLSGGTLLGTGRTLTVDGDWNQSAGTFTHGGSSVVVLAVGGNGITAIDPFYDLTVNVSATQNSNVTVAGTLTTGTGIYATGTNDLSVGTLLHNTVAGTITGGTGTISVVNGSTIGNANNITKTGGTIEFITAGSEAITGTVALNAGAGTVTISRPVTGTSALTITAGTINIGSSITTNSVVFSGPVILTADSSVTSSTGVITFGSTVNTDGTVRTLGLNAATTLTFSGVVGSVANPGTRPGTLTVDSTTTTQSAAIYLAGDLLNQSGTWSTGTNTLTLTGSLVNGGTLTAGTTTISVGASWTNNGTFTANGSTVSLGGTGGAIDGTNGANGANAFNILTITGNAYTSALALDVSSALTISGGSLTQSANALNADSITLNGGDLSVAVSYTVTSDVVVNVAASNLSGAGTGTIGGNLDISDGAVDSTGPIGITGDVLLSGGTLLGTGRTLTVDGDWNQSAGTFTHGGSSVVVLAVGGNGITAIDPFYDLTVNVSATQNSNVTVAGTLTTGTGIYATGTNDLSAGTLLHNTVAGTITGGTGTISVVNGSTIANNITKTDGIIEFITAGSEILTGDVNLNAGGTGTITINRPMSGAFNLTLSAGTIVIDNTIGSITSLTATGAVNLGADITTTGNQIYNNGVFLTAPVILTATTGIAVVDFNNTLNGGQNLTLDVAGTTTFDLAVGGTIPIGIGTGAAITVNSTGTTEFVGTVGTASGMIQADAAGTITFRENITLGAGDTASTFNADVVLDGLTVSSSNDLTIGNAGTDALALSTAAVDIDTTGFDLTVNSEVFGGNQNLTLSSGVGDVVVNGVIGNLPANALQSLTATGTNIQLYSIGASGTVGINSNLNVTANNRIELDGQYYNSTGAQQYSSGPDVLAPPDYTEGGTRVLLSGDGEFRASSLTFGNALAAGANNIGDVYLDFPGWVLTLYTNITCSRFAFFNGTINFSGTRSLSTTNNLGGDFVVLGGGGAYTVDDSDWLGVDTRFEYPGQASLAYDPLSYNAIFGDLADVTINVGNTGVGDFYVNGTDLVSSTASPLLTLNLQDNSGADPVYNNGTLATNWGSPYNIALNMTVQNSVVTGGSIGAVESVTDNGNNSTYDYIVPAVGWDFTRPDILTVETVWDDAMLITFTEPIANINNEISSVIGANLLLTDAGVTDVDITETVMSITDDGTSGISTDGQGNLTSFIIRFGTTWKTDANNASAGAGASTDTTGDNTLTTIPNLSFIKTLFFDAGGKNPIQNYGNNGFPVFQSTSDSCPPVIIDVTTGNHGATGDDYDHHNYMLVRYSEPIIVTTDDGSTTRIATGDTFTNQIGDSFPLNGTDYLGEIPNTTGPGTTVAVTVTGVLDYTNPSYSGASVTGGFYSGSNGMAQTNTLERIDAYELQFNIVSYNDGSYWPGYLGQNGMDITQPEIWTGLVSNNVRDGSPQQNRAKITTGTVTQLGGGWDVDPPAVAIYKNNNAPVILEAIPLDESASSYYDRVEFHVLDDGSTVWNTDTDHPDGTKGIRDSSFLDTSAFGFDARDSLPPYDNSYNDSLPIATDITNKTYQPSGAGIDVADDPYFSITLSAAPWDTLTRMAVEYDEDIGFMTDLAGNRVRSFLNYAVEYVPPEISLTLAMPGSDTVYVEFSEAVYGDPNAATDVDAGDFFYTGGALTIDTVTNLNSPANTQFEFTLSGDLSRNDIFTGRINIVPLSVFDEEGNAFRDNFVRRVSDLGIDVVEPVWASDGIHAENINEGSTLKDFDGTGRLLDRDILIQSRVNASVVAGSSMRLYYDANVPSSLLQNDFWLPSYHPVLAPSGNFQARYVNANEVLNNGLQNFIISSSDKEMDAGNTIEFMFVIDDLPCVRLSNPNDIWSYEPYKIRIEDIRKQKGGVTILNNVINPNNGDKAVLMYDVPNPGVVTAQIFTLNGNLVRILQRGRQAAGTYQYVWDGRNNAGNIVARGIYFVRVVGPDTDEIRKIMVVK